MAATATAKTRKSKWWLWLLVVVGLLLLVLGALFAAEAYARAQVQSRVQAFAIEYLGVPIDEPILLSYATPVLPQLIQGSVHDVSASAQRVSFGELSADLAFTASSVPLNDTDSLVDGQIELWVDQAQLQALVDSNEAVPVSELRIDGENLTAVWDFEVLYVPMPISITVGVSALDGELVLSPDAFHMAGIELNAAQLEQQFGRLVSLITRPWPVCIAENLPRGITLSGVQLDDGLLGVRFNLSENLVSDPTMLELGTCE